MNGKDRIKSNDGKLYQDDKEHMSVLPGTEVLFGVIDIIGQKQAPKIIAASMFNPSVTRIIACGPPGVGKTTWIEQYRRYITTMLGGYGIEVIEALYEDVLDRAYTQFGPNAESEYKEEFNQMLYEEFKAPPLEVEETNGNQYHVRKIIKVGEIVGVGNTKQKDRGVSAFSAMMADTRQQDEETADTIYTFFMPDPLLQIIAGLARSETRNLPHDVVRDTLDERYGMVITGLESPARSLFTHPNFPEELRGMLIKERLARAAQPHHITQINWEIFLQGLETARKEGREEELKHVKLPTTYAQWFEKSYGRLKELAMTLHTKLEENPDIVREARTVAWYIDYHSRQQSGLPQDRVFSVFNPVQTLGDVHQYISNSEVRAFLKKHGIEESDLGISVRK